jgi:hypothetical protein
MVVLENLAAVVVEAGVQRLFLQTMDQIQRVGQTTILATPAIHPAVEGTMRLLKSSKKSSVINDFSLMTHVTHS